MAQVEKNAEGKWVLYSEWHVEDVINQCPWVNEDQAVEVLEAVADNHDANIGINWDVIEMWAEHLFPEPLEVSK